MRIHLRCALFWARTLLATTLWLANWSTALLAQGLEPIEIDVTDTHVENINSKIVRLIDPSNTLGFDDIKRKQDGWARPASDNEALDLQRTTIWAKVRIGNTSDAEKNVYLEFSPAFLEEIRVFSSNGDQIDSTGSTLRSSDLEAFPTVKIPVEPKGATYFIELRSRSNSLSVVLRGDLAGTKKIRSDLMIMAGLTGALAALMLYHLFLFLTYRSRTYLLYSMFVASSILFAVSFTSFHHQLLPYSAKGFSLPFWWSGIAASLMFLSIYLFSADILEIFPSLKKKSSKLSISLLAIPVVNLANIIGIFTTNNPTILGPLRAFALIQIVVMTSCALWIWWKSERKNLVAFVYAISWTPFVVSTAAVIAWLAGALAFHDLYAWGPQIAVVAQSILLAFAAGQKLNLVTKDKLHEQQEKLRVMDQLKVQVDNLQRRDKVITSFVSQQIVDEMDRGEDPLSFRPHNVEKSVVFLDMHNFTAFSESRLPIDAHAVLNSYFELINRVTYSGGGRVEKIIGDGMMLSFDSPKACLSTIVELRQQLSAKNRQRVERKELPVKFGLGISHGMMLAANFGSKHKLDRTYVGDVVNIAARLETITRSFAVDVLCSREFVEQLGDYKYVRPAGYVLLKGKQKKSLVYEIFEHNLPAVVDWKLGTIPDITNAIELELQGQYDAAIDTLMALINRCPEHSYKKGAIMDQSLETMVQAIEEKMKQLGIATRPGGALAKKVISRAAS